jgi:uncharacterized membrane protein YoaK (UPF0700 family)
MESLDRPRRVLAAGLAGLAGYVDAVGYLSANRYFVSFMSGNTTRMATDFASGGTEGAASAAIPALLIAGFVAGVATGGVVAHRAGPWRKPAVLALVTLLLTAATVAALSGLTAGTMACLVLAMGALNNAVRRGEVAVALTYLTGALVRIGQGLARWFTGQRSASASSYVALWLSLATGAAAGAAAFGWLGAASLAAAAAASLALTGAGYRIAVVSRRS